MTSEREPHVRHWEVFERSDGGFSTFPHWKFGSLEEGGVPEGWCTGYARRVAKFYFGIEYDPLDAWEYRYKYKVIPVLGFRDLRIKVRSQGIKPGCLVGMYNPNSELNGKQRDSKGKAVDYTHLVVLLGENTENMSVFGQQVIDVTGIETDVEMHRESYRPIEIILPIKPT